MDSSSLIRKSSKQDRQKQIEQMKILGTCICGKPSAIPTGYCIDCWNKLETIIREEHRGV